MIRFALIWLALCSVSLGQIKLVEQNLQTWVGFENPQIVNGVVVAGQNSKPVLASTSQTILVKKQADYKSISVLVQKLPTLERIELDTVEGGYRFKPGTAAGLYNIIILASDPGTGLDTITVAYKPTPDPVKPDEPVTPEPLPNLDKLSAEARKVVVDLVQNMAKDIEAVNADIDAGKVKTVMESAAATVQRDIATRNKFKADMNKLLEPRLGNAALPQNAKQTFAEIAAGWRTVK